MVPFERIIIAAKNQYMDTSVLDRQVIEYATRNVITISPTTTVEEAIRTMVAHDIRRLPILDDKGRVLGIMTLIDILETLYSFVRGTYSDEIGTVSIYSDFLAAPAMRYATRSVLTARPDTTVREVIRMFLEREIGSMPIVEGGRLRAIFTEWDAVRLISEMDFPFLVRDVMTRIIYVLTHESTIFDALEGIVAFKFRRYPIVDASGKITGMAHAKDLLRYLSDTSVIAAIREGKALDVLSAPITKAANSPLVTARPDMYVRDVARKMLEYDVGGVPVVSDDNRVVGLVTEKTLLVLLSEEK